jgi:hypothetical protein
MVSATTHDRLRRLVPTELRRTTRVAGLGLEHVDAIASPPCDSPTCALDAPLLPRGDRVSERGSRDMTLLRFWRRSLSFPVCRSSPTPHWSRLPLASIHLTRHQPFGCPLNAAARPGILQPIREPKAVLGRIPRRPLGSFSGRSRERRTSAAAHVTLKTSALSEGVVRRGASVRYPGPASRRSGGCCGRDRRPRRIEPHRLPHAAGLLPSAGLRTSNPRLNPSRPLFPHQRKEAAASVLAVGAMESLPLLPHVAQPIPKSAASTAAFCVCRIGSIRIPRT